jgi:hypothetical protein
MKHVGKNTTSTAKINKRGAVARLKLLPDAHEVRRDTDLFVDVFFRVCSRPQLNEVETQLCHLTLMWSPWRGSGGYFAESQTKCSGSHFSTKTSHFLERRNTIALLEGKCGEDPDRGGYFAESQSTLLSSPFSTDRRTFVSAHRRRRSNAERSQASRTSPEIRPRTRQPASTSRSSEQERRESTRPSCVRHHSSDWHKTRQASFRRGSGRSCT